MTNEYQEGRRAQPYPYEGGLVEDPEEEFPIMPPTQQDTTKVEQNYGLEFGDCGIAPQPENEAPVAYFQVKELILSCQRCTHARNTDDGESLVDKVFRLR